MMLRSTISFAAICSVLVTAAPGAMAQPQGQARPAGGFCVNAPALPQLGAETQWVQQQNAPPSRGTGYVGSSMTKRAMAAPPSASMSPSPPSPPPSPVMAAPADADYGASVAEERSAPSTEPSFVPPRPRPPRPQPEPQSGLLTAGEHNDLLNPELYARYVQRSNLGQSLPDLPVVDTKAVLTVEVKDSAGRPVPFAQVRVTCSDGNSITTATLADGRAIFFPGIDRLSPDVRISASRGGASLGADRSAQISRTGGGQQIAITAGQRAQAVRKLDLMLVVDTTGSMSDEIRYLQAELKSVVAALSRRHPQVDVRIGFVFYRDEQDDYVTHSVPFDGRMDRAQAALDRQYAAGGGDYPEAMDQALIRAVGQEWRPDAVKSLLLVADAPPHDERMGRTWGAARVARQKRIQITPVAASGVGDKAEFAMRAMAAMTQSSYLFLTDDSGVGNPHAAPAIDCYLVTRLDAALRRVLDGQLSGRRIEPEKAEVIRTVGTYSAGRCILPPDFIQN